MKLSIWRRRSLVAKQNQERKAANGGRQRSGGWLAAAAL